MAPQELRKLRLKLDLTQQQMAEKLGIVRHTYNEYERGKKPINKTVEKLAETMV